MRWIYYKSWQISFWIALIISYLDLLLLAWVSGLPKGLGERRFLDGRVGMGEEEKGRPDTKPFSKSCDTSKIWMWQWLDNTKYPWRHRPQVNTSRAIGEEKPLNFSLKFWFHVLLYGQRRREEFKKALVGALKFFPGIKITPEQELCFQSRVVKRKDISGVWKSLIYQPLLKLCRSISFTWPGQRRQYQCF